MSLQKAIDLAKARLLTETDPVIIEAIMADLRAAERELGVRRKKFKDSRDENFSIAEL